MALDSLCFNVLCISSISCPQNLASSQASFIFFVKPPSESLNLANNHSWVLPCHFQVQLPNNFPKPHPSHVPRVPVKNFSCASTVSSTPILPCQLLLTLTDSFFQVSKSTHHYQLQWLLHLDPQLLWVRVPTKVKYGSTITSPSGVPACLSCCIQIDPMLLMICFILWLCHLKSGRDLQLWLGTCQVLIFETFTHETFC